jgi:hypothetical protein
MFLFFFGFGLCIVTFCMVIVIQIIFYSLTAQGFLNNSCSLSGLRKSRVKKYIVNKMDLMGELEPERQKSRGVIVRLGPTS